MKKTTSKSTKSVKQASSQDLLGGFRPRKVALEEPTCCFACQDKLKADRVAALRQIDTPIDSWTCVKCSTLVTTPRLGMFMGESGTSELKIVDRVYNDSVRDIFVEPDTVEQED